MTTIDLGVHRHRHSSSVEIFTNRTNHLQFLLLYTAHPGGRGSTGGMHHHRNQGFQLKEDERFPWVNLARVWSHVCAVFLASQ